MTNDDSSPWNRGFVLGLAIQSCVNCNGLGLASLPSPGAPHGMPCNCVLRAVFRACYGKFRECVEKAGYQSVQSLDRREGKASNHNWGRKNEEYLADFMLVSKRTLTPAHYRLFKYHFLLGADWKLCCEKLRLDRGEFFHDVYRVQKNLGRAFAQVLPYPLYPTAEYFGGSTRDVTARHQVSPKPQPVRPPLALKEDLPAIARNASGQE